MDIIPKECNKKHHKAKKKKNSGNSRAFAYRSGIRAAKSQKRALDIATKTHHIPHELSQGENPAPVVVSVFGPPRVGKSTLIASLVKRFNKQKISNIKGPVTIAASKTQKITLIECNNDINCMIDLAKISDIILILIDATFGLELRIFEIMTILRTHSLPKVIGILTHVDLVRQNKSFIKNKKRIKKRFWEEVYEGAKLISFNDFKNNLYDLRQVFILSQYLTKSTSPPQSWRTTHPYILSDRFEDLTNPEDVRKDPKINRHLALYGYVHGTYLKHNKVHISGVGDYEILRSSLLEDPCVSQVSSSGRLLDTKRRAIYAPFSGVGGVIFDKDAVYINIENSKPKNEENEITETNLRLSSFQKITETIDKKLNKTTFELFPNLPAEEVDACVLTESIPNSLNTMNDTLSDKNKDISRNESKNGKKFKNSLDIPDFKMPEESIPENIENSWKYAHIFLHRKIYKDIDKKETHVRDDLFVPREKTNFLVDSTLPKDIVRFPWNSDDESFVQGLFDQSRGENSGQITPIEEDDDPISDESSLENESTNEDEKDNKPKASKIKIFEDVKKDEKYLDGLKDEIKQKIAKTNEEFKDLSLAERVMFQGYSPGMYVRLEIQKIPAKFIENFDPSFPILIGGVLPGEDTMGFLKLRVKKCKYFQKTLKTRDPLILSIGWRRFQTVMLYAHEDANKRLRAIKYTPKQMYCVGMCYGPFTLPGYGVLGIQELTDEAGKGFRISMIGVTLENDKKCNIMKKLKLVGYPFKIHKNTAFIEKMFNSSLEVAKFEGGVIKTVSGIRGHIKKAISDIEGAFRAKFEDKILLSDIISLRTWTCVECPKYCNFVQNLLLPVSERFSWLGMKTVAQLRRESGLPIEYNKDSVYKSVERDPVEYAHLKVPKKLITQLPFSARPKNVLTAKQKEKRPKLTNPTEKKASSLLNELSRIQGHVLTTRNIKRKKDAEKRAEKTKKVEEEQNKKRKINSKRIYKRHILKMSKNNQQKNSLSM